MIVFLWIMSILKRLWGLMYSIFRFMKSNIFKCKQWDTKDYFLSSSPSLPHFSCLYFKFFSYYYLGHASQLLYQVATFPTLLVSNDESINWSKYKGNVSISKSANVPCPRWILPQQVNSLKYTVSIHLWFIEIITTKYTSLF